MSRINGQLPPIPAHTGLLRRGAAPLVIGHRGNSSAAPENTLSAFRSAWQAGVHWVETDVQPTADLVPVLFHDDTLERTSSGSGTLREQRFAELIGLDAGAWFGADFGNQPATTVPTLHALLSELPDEGRVLLEIKGPHTAAQLIAELAVIRATGTTTQVWLQSFEVEALAELAEAMPDGWRGLLRGAVDDDPVTVCRELGVASYNPEWETLLAAPADTVAALHDAGVSVICWTANNEAGWEALTDLGVDGIITDRPADLLAWQRAR